MACGTLNGYKPTCPDNNGGIEKIYVIGYDQVIQTGFTYSANGSITGITLAHSSTTFKVMESAQFTATVVEQQAYNPDMYSRQITQTIVLKFNKQTADLRNEIRFLATNFLMVAAKDINGYWHLYGQQFGLRMTDGGGNIGAKMNEDNSYNVTLTGMEKDFARFIGEDIITPKLDDSTAVTL